jgi:predicted dehydrogenase
LPAAPGSWHLPHLHRNPNATIAAIVDPTAAPTSPMNPELKTVAALADMYGAPAFGSLDELLAHSGGGGGGGLDGVIIGSNHASHHELATAAMRAGLHVLCEKPMTVDVGQAQELLALATASPGLAFMVNNTANWRAQSRRAQRYVRDGAIGEVRHASVLFHTPLAWVFNDATNTGWNEPSGGMLGNGFGWGQLAHPLAWLFMVSGLTPAKVFSFAGKGTATAADMFDSVSILCTNGATVSVSGVAAIPGDNKVIDNRLVGTEGMLAYGGVDEDKGKTSLDGDGGGEEDEYEAEYREWMEGQPESYVPSVAFDGLRVHRFDGGIKYNPDSDSGDYWRHGEMVNRGFSFENTDMEGDGPESLQAFIDACRGEPYFPGADAEVGLKAVATLDALYRSALSGAAESTGL